MGRQTKKRKNMIIKHCAMNKKDGMLIVGYIVRQEDEFFIFQETGERIQVIGSSIFPLIDKYGTLGVGESGADEISGIPISNLGLGKYITNNFMAKGAIYLEDLQTWTDKDYSGIRGLGKVRKQRVREVLEQHHLVFNGTCATKGE